MCKRHMGRSTMMIIIIVIVIGITALMILVILLIAIFIVPNALYTIESLDVVKVTKIQNCMHFFQVKCFTLNF